MTATPEQVISIGKASRDLLRFGWQRQPRSELMIVNGLIAVGRTIATDPQASAVLLREAIDSEHLKEHGYKELRWVAQEIQRIAKADPSLAVDIYDAAYGFSETSDQTTPMGNSVLLALTSNRRQDYQGAWYQLSEAIPAILDNDPETGVRAVVRGLYGYVQRQNRPNRDEVHGASFSLGPYTASFETDWSYSWYNGGYRSSQDAPALLIKFEELLGRVASQADAAATIQQIVATIAQEPHVVAAVWTSLLVAGTKRPDLYAASLLPVACATPVMHSFDSRFQLGGFITAAYPTLTPEDRAAIEASILSMTDDDPATKRNKSILAGCIPRTLIATDVMRAFVQTLEQAGELANNAPVMRMTTSTRDFGTDAYLESEDVSLKDPESASIRELMRAVEELKAPDGRTDLSLASVRRQLAVMAKLYERLNAKIPRKVSETLIDHACGHLAEAAGRLARAKPPVLAAASVHVLLRDILLFSATSKNPRFNAEHANNFNDSPHWGGPSARTAAAHGLLDFTRASKKQDPEVMSALRKLARDRMPEVRLNVVQNLPMLHVLDADWMWSELEYALAKDRARGVVNAAIEAVARLAYLDIPRVIKAAKGVLRRYAGKDEPGMAKCRADAATLIFDIHIHGKSDEADQFAASQIDAIPRDADHLTALVARYSSSLLRGNVEDASAADNLPRRRTLAFYTVVIERAFQQIDERAARLDMRSFNTWPSEDQTVVRSMFGLLNEVSQRLHFATGNYHGNVQQIELSPQLVRFYQETKPIVSLLANAIVAPIAHHLIQMLEMFIQIDPAGVFEQIAQAVRSAQRGGYSDERMAAELIVRIVELYLADYRAIFTDRARLDDLMDCLDVFARAGWPAAQELTFRLGEIWR